MLKSVASSSRSSLPQRRSSSRHNPWYRRVRFTVFTGLVGIFSLGMVNPAYAQVSDCNVFSYDCATETIPSSTGHWIEWGVENAQWDDSNWVVYDADNGAIVGQGYIGTGNSRSGRINGLYGRYYLYVYNSSWDTIGWIHNA